MDLNSLVYQQAPCEDNSHLWLRDNLGYDREDLASFVRETEEFAQTLKVVAHATDADWDQWDNCIDCHGDFDEWLYSIGGCYIQDVDAQEVLVEAIIEELESSGYGVGEYKRYPVAIYQL